MTAGSRLGLDNEYRLPAEESSVVGPVEQPLEGLSKNPLQILQWVYHV